MAEAPEKPRIQPWSLWLIFAIMAGGILVTFNYQKRNRAEAHNPRPPYVAKVERDFEALNRDGKKVQLSETKGSLWIGSSLHTGTSQRAPMVAGHLRELLDEFSDESQLRLIIFSADPELDTLQRRNDFLTQHGLDKPQVWYLTAEPSQLKRFLSRYLRWMPSRKLDGEAAKTEAIFHDVRLVLVDGKANIRGFYQLLHPKYQELEKKRLYQDLRYLLNSP